MENLSKFEEIIKVNFKDKSLLQQALTHRSYINENKNYKLPHNERLEFLGDAVLELVVTEFLFKKYPDKTEGDLTSYRAALVNTNTLSLASDRLNVNNFVLLSRGESKDVGRARAYILANAFEAIVGAIYLDSGYESARDFIADNLFHLTDDIVSKKLWQDSKSYFQERAQDEAGITPSYNTLKEQGPDHNKIFTVGVFLGEELVAEGDGQSKQEAEQVAASLALKKKNWN